VSKAKPFKIKDLRDFLWRLLKERGITPERIVLFGSYVKGGFGQESDMDLIIVSKDFRNRGVFERVEMTGGIGRELVRRFMLPFDLIYYSDEEWENSDFLLINEARRKGRVIYRGSGSNLTKDPR